MIKITIDTDNAAFHVPGDADSDDFSRHDEIGRILGKLASTIKDSSGPIGRISLRDSNGNKVGECVEVADE